MGLVRVTGPTDFPVDLDEAKAMMRVLTEEEDALIEALVRASVRACENEARRSFITQTWRLELPGFPCGAIQLPMGPVQAVAEFNYFDTGNLSTALDETLFQLDLSRQIARVVPAVAEAWPTYQSQPGAVVIDYTAGYGDDASAVPDDIRIAVMMHATWLYTNREGGDMPATVSALLAPYKAQSLA